MDISFRGFGSSQIREAMIEQIDRALDILPWWVKTLEVIYQPGPDADDPDKPNQPTLASVLCTPEYRKVKLYIYGAFLALDDAQQIATLCHEFAEFYISPIRNFMDDTLLNENLTDFADGERALIAEVWRQRCESVCEDLSAVFVQQLEWSR